MDLVLSFLFDNENCAGRCDDIAFCVLSAPSIFSRYPEGHDEYEYSCFTADDIPQFNCFHEMLIEGRNEELLIDTTAYAFYGETCERSKVVYFCNNELADILADEECILTDGNIRYVNSDCCTDQSDYYLTFTCNVEDPTESYNILSDKHLLEEGYVWSVSIDFWCDNSGNTDVANYFAKEFGDMFSHCREVEFTVWYCDQ